MSVVIEPEDRITYAEAPAITQRSPGYLLKLVKAGRLVRVGGQWGAAYRTFLSRIQVEKLALVIVVISSGSFGEAVGQVRRELGSEWSVVGQRPGRPLDSSVMMSGQM